MSTSGASYDALHDFTHIPNSPLADPLLSLQRAGRSSFTANDLDRLATWLQRAGWRREAGRSDREYARFLRGRALIVAYNTTTILVQGAQPASTIELLNRLAPGQGMLPFATMEAT